MHEHTAATKPITFDDDDDYDDSNSNIRSNDTSIQTEMIIIVGFALIAAHFILACIIFVVADFHFVFSFFACSF